MSLENPCKFINLSLARTLGDILLSPNIKLFFFMSYEPSLTRHSVVKYIITNTRIHLELKNVYVLVLENTCFPQTVFNYKLLFSHWVKHTIFTIVRLNGSIFCWFFL